MRGQEILARTISVPTRRGKTSTAWQYHSRSDSHSKVACWTLLFDALHECDVLRQHAEAGRLGFGINFEMVGPISKRLDLVLTRIQPGRDPSKRISFADLAAQFGVVLTDEEAADLGQLPPILHDEESAAEVVLAVEAKACMTEHVKALPRLHAEILATGYLAKLAAPHCILASYTLVNSAATFRAPSESVRTNTHGAGDAARVIEMLALAVPLARNLQNLIGYDVIGTTVINCRNDGSPVTVDAEFAWPDRAAHVRYERLVRGICSEYRARAGR